MLFPIEVIDDSEEITRSYKVILQSTLIITVYPKEDNELNSIILYKEEKRELVYYEIPMTVEEFWSYYKRQQATNLLN